MAKAKTDFTTSVNRVKDTIAEATQLPGQLEINQDGTVQEAQEVQKTQKERRTYNAQETQEALETRKTQGRKGVSAPRINLAFSPSVYDYIKTMAAVRGETMTDFVNVVLQQSLEENQELYNKAKEFKSAF